MKEFDTRYKSQFGQDFFLYNYIFQGKNEGFFVDVGANHPITINNSYFFEKQGWKGLAFEPQNALNSLWTDDMRSTECLPYALGSEEKEVEFVELVDEHVLSGIAGAVNKKSNSNIQKYSVRQRRLSDVLMERGVKDVDILFIDVEGYEMEVLKGIDFEKSNILCITIENNDGYRGAGKNHLRKYLCQKGDYILIARLTSDDVYLRKDLWEKRCTQIEHIING